MKYCYLFEAKSIQSYLFESGKLKDVIAASERLDRLIDSEENSVLNQVLKNAQLESDLLNANRDDAPNLIRFLRCKGGAFYAYSDSKVPLLSLRSLWTLTVQQLFPSLEFTDALTAGETLTDAIDSGHRQLAADRNTPSVKFPIGSAISSRYQRTGKVSVPVSTLANRASMKEEFDNGADSFDLDTEHHRQAYQAFEMRDEAALQDRFTPDELKGQIHYPINLDKDFAFSAIDLKSTQSDAVKDIALIHIDGNGLGILLMALKSALKGKSDSAYRQAFREFSGALNHATIIAAQQATQFVYDKASYQHNAQTYLPMRPIVLGGDDVTLLCRADLALDYSKIFCREFKKASKQCLKSVFRDYLKESAGELKSYLTASGGILYHKAGHPFTQSHHLVEGLCEAAKKLTKSINTSDKQVDQPQVGQAALAIYRLSNAITDDFDTIMKQSQTFAFAGDHTITLGQSRYFVDAPKEAGIASDFDVINDIITLSNSKNAPVAMAKWRQMAAHIAMNDLAEANRIYFRALELCQDKQAQQKLAQLLQLSVPKGVDQLDGWYWLDDQGNAHTIINDLLILDHFKLADQEQLATDTQEAQQ